MEHDEGSENIGHAIRPARPPKGLYAVIVGRIHTEKKLESARKRAVYFSIALGGSLASFFVAFSSLREVVFQSGLWQLLSLPLSDSGAVAQNWHDFGFFFLESLPVTQLIVFLGALLLLLASLKYLFRYAGLSTSLLKLLSNK